MKTRMMKDKIYLQNYCYLENLTVNSMIKLNVYLVCSGYQENFWKWWEIYVCVLLSARRINSFLIVSDNKIIYELPSKVWTYVLRRLFNAIWWFIDLSSLETSNVLLLIFLLREVTAKMWFILIHDLCFWNRNLFIEEDYLGPSH